MSERKDGKPRQRASQPVADRIAERLDKSGECWLWLGSRSSTGFGQISVKGRMCLVHRLVWENENGPVPVDMWVTHTCDTTECANPDHLRLITRGGRPDPRPVVQRILAHTDTAGDCWAWLGGKTTAGYGNLLVNGKKEYVHRLMWEAKNGPVPAGLTIDHWCRVRNCVNPDHLRPVTQGQQSENRSPQKSKTGLRGVYPSPNGGFYVRVSQRHVGSYNTVDAAHAAAVAERLRVMNYSDGR